MTHRRLFVFGVLAAALPICTAQSPNTLSTQEKTAGWKLLFDGKTLNGWNDPARKKPVGDAWSVADGWIKSTRRAKIREDLLTDGTFGDFELTFEWRISEGGNSGVKYRVQERFPIDSAKTPQLSRFEDRAEFELRNHLSSREHITPGSTYEEYVVAFEYQVIDDARHADAKRGPDRTSGALYGMVPPTRPAARPAGEINQSRIVLRGNHVEHWLNGEKVVETNLDAPEIAKKISQRWPPQTRVYELLTKQAVKRTPVVLQNHNDEAWFRNIKIRELR